MAYSVSHLKLGRQLLDKLPLVLSPNEHALFLLGCLGADIFFYDQLPPPLFRKHTKKIIGNAFHDMEAVQWWQACRTHAENYAILPYIAGLLCHFALDAAVHPYICAKASGKEHTRLEARIDSLLFAPEDEEIYPIIQTSKDTIASALHLVDAFWNDLALSLFQKNITGVYLRAYRNFRFFSRVSFDKSGRKLSFLHAMETLLGKAGLLSGFLVSPRAILDGDILNLEKTEWASPWKPHVARNDSFLTLFENACMESAKLVEALYANDLEQVSASLHKRSMQKGEL